MLTPLDSREGTLLSLNPVRGHSILLEQKLAAIWDFRRVVVVNANGLCASIDMDEGEVVSIAACGSDGVAIIRDIRLRSLADDAPISVELRVSPV